jgi:hypothetical protein
LEKQQKQKSDIRFCHRISLFCYAAEGGAGYGKRKKELMLYINSMILQTQIARVTLPERRQRVQAWI